MKIILYLEIVIGIIILAKFEKDNEKKINEYYYGKKSELTYIKKEFPLLPLMFTIKITFFFIFVYSISSLIFNCFPKELFYNTGRYVDEIPNLMASIFISVITFYGIITVINKKYYITYSIVDIFYNYKIFEKTFKMFIFLIIVYICYFISPFFKNVMNSNIYFSFKIFIIFYFLWFLYLLVPILYLLLEILLSTSKMEFKMLDILYKNFYYKDFKKYSNIKDWDEEGIYICLDYLLSKYINSYKYINYKSIKDIKFDSIHIQDKEELLSKKGSFLFTLFMFFFIFIINIDTINLKFFIFLVLLSFIIYLIFLKIKFFRNVMMIIIFDRCGYFFKIENKAKSKNKYTSQLQFRQSNMIKYILSIQNILALYKIALYKNEQYADFIMNKILKYFNEKCKSEEEIKSASIIIIIMYYFEFERLNKKMNNMHDFKDILQNKVILAQSEKYFKYILEESVEKMFVNAILADIKREINENCRLRSYV